ncbi:hypothetical protein BHE74_00024767 [Ensete ventricosum]|nr:hypothetical protein BHE74_00024767 [Ensete ventricosum]
MRHITRVGLRVQSYASWRGSQLRISSYDGSQPPKPPPHRLVATPTANTSCCSTQDNENRDGQVASSRRLIRPMRTADARLGQERKRSQFSRRDSAIGNRVGITPCGSCGGARVLAGVGDGRAVDQGGAGKAWRVLRRGD